MRGEIEQREEELWDKEKGKREKEKIKSKSKSFISLNRYDKYIIYGNCIFVIKSQL